jgi:hypothetical protein
MTSRTRPPSHPVLLPVLAAGLILGLGCRKDEVSRTSVDKRPAAVPSAPAAMPGMPAMPPGAAMPPGQAMPPGMMPAALPPGHGQGALKWKLPQGWTEAPGTGMRVATLAPPAALGKAEVPVTVLAAPAGGELANVNRWRGQLNLPPIDEQALKASRRTVASKAGQVIVHDFTSDGAVKSRMVVGMVTTTDGQIWFLKLQGEAGPVEKAKAGFQSLLGTLHLD